MFGAGIALLGVLLFGAPAAQARIVDGWIGGTPSLQKESWSDSGDKCDGKEKEQPVSGGAFCRRAAFADIDLDFTYRIGGSEYLLYGHVKAPVVGTNSVSCEIRRMGTSTAADRSPYVCTATFQDTRGDALSPRPSWVVQYKPTRTVTDRQEQGKVIKSLCGDDVREGACRYLGTTLKSDLSKPAVQATVPLKNCTDEPAKRHYEVEVGTRTETSLDVTVGIEGKFLEFLKVKVEATFGAKWENERFTREGAEIELKPKQVGAFYYEAAYDEVRGDLQLTGPDAVYVLPDVVYDFPTRSGKLGLLTARVWAGDCGERPPTVCLPDGASDGAPICASVTPAQADPAWCLTGGFTDGTCPPRVAFSDLVVAWPADWARWPGLPFAHWDAVVDGPDAGVARTVSCPPGAQPGGGPDGVRRTADGSRSQAWITCVTDATAPAAPASPAPASSAPARRGSATRVASAPVAHAARAGSAARTPTGTVYVSLPLSRHSDSAARDIAAAARLAFADHGRRAGGARLRMKVLSDANSRTGAWSPHRARANARRAAADRRTLAYLGDASSGATADALGILNRAGVLMVSPSSTAVELTADDRFRPSGRATFARVVPNDFQQANGLARSMRELAVQHVFVVHDREVYGRGLGRLFGAAAPHYGVRIAGSAAVPRTPAGRLRLSQRIARSGATAVLFAGLAENGARPLLRDLAATSGPPLLMFGGDGLADDERFLAGARKDGFEAQLHLTSPAVLPDTLPVAGQKVYRRVWARTGRRPDAYAVYAYEAVDAMLDAMDRARVSRRSPRGARAAVVRAFFAIANRRSPVGTYSITRNGDTTLRSYGEYTVHGGALQAPLCIGC